MASKSKKESSQGLEASLWDAANKLRSNMDAAEYKHVVLGLIFLKYVSDVFQKRRTELEKLTQTPDSDYYMPSESARNSILESRDEYTSEGVFWVPEGHRWDDLRKAAKQNDIGSRIDAAMDAIEKENNSLKGVLPKNYARKELTPAALGGLIDTFSREDLTAAEHVGLDVLGRVFEYMVAQFASAEGKLGGEFYTPRSVVQLLVEMIQPFTGRVYDPACGSGGMFVQADSFVKAHGGSRNDISVFGQEMNPTTWRLAKMNLALRGIDANLGAQWGSSFTDDRHPDLKADFILANPPFNLSTWGGEALANDPRWKYGVPPDDNANFAWIQHMLSHTGPQGVVATVLANSSLSAERTGEREIRSKIIDAGLVECVIILPKNLFYTTSIPVCIWILRKGRSEAESQNTLMIDARNLGDMVSKVLREIRPEDISLLADLYQTWKQGALADTGVPGLYKIVKLNQIMENGYGLSPNQYIDSGASALKLDENESSISQSIARANGISSRKHSIKSEISSGAIMLNLPELENFDWSSADLESLKMIQTAVFERHFNLATLDSELPLDFREWPLPAGWNIRPLVEVADIVDCLHSKKPDALEELPENGGVLLEVKNIRFDGLLDFRNSHFISEKDFANWTRNLALVEGDCVVTNTGRVGAVARIPFGQKLAMGRNMTAIRSKLKINEIYIARFLMSNLMKSETYRLTDIGTVLDSLNVKGIKKLQILWPDQKYIERYDAFARPLQELIELNAALDSNVSDAGEMQHDE